jgi:hypothetical protein
VAGVKLGPGLPHRIIPGGVEAEWLSDRGDTVEVGLWSGRGALADGRAALLLPDDRLVVDPTAPPLTAGPVRSVLYEPAGAVTRAGGIDQLGQALGAHRLHPDLAYLTAEELRPTPYATAFEVLEVHPYSEQALRLWTRERGIGTLEIKKRGLDLDPAVLRKRLKLRGSGSATVVLTRTVEATVLLVVRRVASPPTSG